MSSNTNITKYLHPNSNSINLKKEASELTKWQELEEILHEANQQSGGDKDQFIKLTGVQGRDFNCYLREVEDTIKQLGGKLYKDRKNDDDNREREREREREQKPPISTLKLLGCQCQYKDKEFANTYVKDLKYDKSKDIVCCLDCQNNYPLNSQSVSTQFLGEELNNRENTLNIVIIYGAKDKPNSDKEKKLGKNYSNLTLHQKERRETVYNNWEARRKKNYGRQKVCRYCPQTFDWDKSLEFLPSKQKVERELTTHETNCPKKNDQKEQQKSKQEKWEQDRKKSGSPFYTCSKCWGKVCLDKKIENWIQAKKQAQADLTYHEKNECAAIDKTGKTITMVPICFSPNQGGNKHAPLNYADRVNENDLVMEQDNETEVIYQQKQSNHSNSPEKSNKGLYIGLVAVGLLVVGVIVWLLMRNKKDRNKVVRN